MVDEEEGLKNALHFPFEGWWKAKERENLKNVLGSHSPADNISGSEDKSAEKWNEIEVKSKTGE